MNALAEDQLWRLRSLLAGTGISFGMYVGKTPEREGEVAGIRLPGRLMEYLTALNQDVEITIRPRANSGETGHISVLAVPQKPVS